MKGKKEEGGRGGRMEEGKMLRYTDRFGGGRARWREGMEEESVKRSLISVPFERKREGITMCVCVCVCASNRPPS